ncbi:hypothetical protein JG687_00003581 [Phytophthora cactorum]|uniref:Uncharacterized protein n=1 Tax=Phytophthora cactorum TaxID=29920 RepID=A0A8T1UU20_9STRA|nr:hypothetical protein JG687_00003581 [Phytophthora cactorum]
MYLREGTPTDCLPLRGRQNTFGCDGCFLRHVCHGYQPHTLWLCWRLSGSISVEA